ncbi:MAG: universal stress protein [Thermoplasmata archaeon]|nr:universal stress protein [Thermoplasmata archaeon]
MTDPLFARLTVTLDGSEFAERALTVAIDLARRYAASLSVLAVAPIVPVYPTATEPWVPTTAGPSEVAFYRKVVDAAVARAKKEGVGPVTGICLEGVVTDEILMELERHPTDLLVMGSRGLSSARRLLLGSVSDAVLHHVKCAVLIVRPAGD